MGLKHDIRRAPAVRDRGTEADLQARIVAGNQVWVVGDIHGHLGTLRALMHRLKLGKEDRVVLLGDMIDRGPDSAGVIEYIREHPQIIAIKGNHEQMAIQSLQASNIELNEIWMAKGGASTWGSYIVAAKGDLHRAKLTFAEDCAWLADLPSHIVLDDWRLVHAGYHPRVDLDNQDEKTLLWIRRAFFKHDAPLMKSDASYSDTLQHRNLTELEKSFNQKLDLMMADLLGLPWTHLPTITKTLELRHTISPLGIRCVKRLYEASIGG